MGALEIGDLCRGTAFQGIESAIPMLGAVLPIIICGVAAFKHGSDPFQLATGALLTTMAAVLVWPMTIGSRQLELFRLHQLQHLQRGAQT